MLEKHPQFRRNLYHQSLFSQQILDENLNNLDIPLYFKGDFFPTIKRIHETQVNLASTAVNEIYRFLLGEITMEETDIAGNPILPY